MRRGLFAFLIALLAAYIRAETITVATDGSGAFSSIQDALNSARDGDTVLVHSGEYVVREPIQFNRLREPGTRPPPGVRNKILRSAGGPTVTTIRLEPEGLSGHALRQSVVAFQEGESEASSIEGFLITGAARGAGIYCYRASPLIRECEVRDNRERGIHVEEGSPRIEACVVTRSFLEGVVLVRSSTEIVDCTILENLGGGIGNYAGSSRITGCRVLSNDGSGLFTNGETGPLVDRCTFMGNRSESFGGGIEARDGPVELRNCLIVGNSANEYGAAMVAWMGGAIRAIHCAIADNFGYERAEGGLSCINGGTIELVNSIVWGNQPLSLCGTSSSSILETEDPLFVKRARYNYFNFKEITIQGIAARVPDFVASPGDYALAADSPALNAGEPVTGIDVDILGVPRACGGGPDLGAYERCTFDPIDCNENGRADTEDVASGDSPDCNRNGSPNGAMCATSGRRSRRGPSIGSRESSPSPSPTWIAMATSMRS